MIFSKLDLRRVNRYLILLFLLRGEGRGILFVWDPMFSRRMKCYVQKNVVVVEGVWSRRNLKCPLINVYAL